MTRTVPTRRMSDHPDLDQVKRQAKELLKAFLAGEPEASAEVKAYYDRGDSAAFALHDAQLVIARSYGFESWPRLKGYVDGVTVARLADAVRARDIAETRRMLQFRPELADMAMSYGDEHRSIHFAVMNRSPEMVRLLMQHGASAREGIDPHRPLLPHGCSPRTGATTRSLRSTKTKSTAKSRRTGTAETRRSPRR